MDNEYLINTSITKFDNNFNIKQNIIAKKLILKLIIGYYTMQL